MAETRPRAVLLAVQLPEVSDGELASSITELGRLVDTLGLDVIARVVQKRPALSKGSVVGLGKLKELAAYTGGPGSIPSAANPKKKKSVYLMGSGEGHTSEDEDEDEDEDAADRDEDGDSAGEGDDQDEVEGGAVVKPLPKDQRATVLVVDHDLTPSQARNLERALEVEVFDRTAVILAIFERHARTREAKLEVEIARLAYMAPRLREVGGGGDRQRGGVGGRGAGESSMELDRRKVRDRIAELRRELEEIDRTARTRRARRADESTVALVGYTNAGKSSLMRALTGSDVYVADKLFATLDTTVRVLKPETKPRILVSDTVGFIKKLPHGLVASFRATLEAAAEAQVLLHVVDASDPAFPSHMQVTQDLLAEIGAAEGEMLLVLNKIDRVDSAARADLARRYPGAVLMSAKNPADVAALSRRIVATFEKDMVHGEIFVPYAEGALLSEIHGTCRVLGEEYEELGTRFRILAAPHVLERLGAEVAGPTRA